MQSEISVLVVIVVNVALVVLVVMAKQWYFLRKDNIPDLPSIESLGPHLSLAYLLYYVPKLITEEPKGQNFISDTLMER